MGTHIELPSLTQVLGDLAGGGIESLSSLMSLPGLRVMRKRLAVGQGKPVLVIPGLTAEDWTVNLMVKLLHAHGFDAFASEIGRNIGDFKTQEKKLSKQLLSLHKKYNQPIAIIGWSWGGRYAGDLAELYPEVVGKVITLGTPWREATFETKPVIIKALHRLGLKDRVDFLLAQLEYPIPIPEPHIPTTALVAMWDAIVHDSLSSIHDDHLHPDWPRENLKVPTTHTGIGFSLFTVMILVNRLLQDQEDWRPYKSKFSLGTLISTKLRLQYY